jgi:hypothetical protein
MEKVMPNVMQDVGIVKVQVCSYEAGFFMYLLVSTIESSNYRHWILDSERENSKECVP